VLGPFGLKTAMPGVATCAPTPRRSRSHRAWQAPARCHVDRKRATPPRQHARHAYSWQGRGSPGFRRVRTYHQTRASSPCALTCSPTQTVRSWCMHIVGSVSVNAASRCRAAYGGVGDMPLTGRNCISLSHRSSTGQSLCAVLACPRRDLLGGASQRWPGCHLAALRETSCATARAERCRAMSPTDANCADDDQPWFQLPDTRCSRMIFPEVLVV
jgi:hypothetical protein